MHNKITFIGGGNMASAIISGLIASGIPGSQIEVVDPSAEARERLAGRFGLQLKSGIGQAHLYEIIVLAVKPQQLPVVAAELASRLKEQLIVSIAAGVRVNDLSRWLGGYGGIVRTMPNTPAMVGAGITGLFAAEGVDGAARSAAEGIMRAVGGVVWVKDEALLDAVTAVSGSGPAYVFYLIEALEVAGVEAGLTPEAARTLALQTFLGASKLALESGEEPASLRARVTSKGGTTEQGIATLEAKQVKAAIAEAVRAACARSVELGEELGRLA
ncbi:MAG: pyrroline-5-carboxylate reductase [Thiobacillaceae bacterium]